MSDGHAVILPSLDTLALLQLITYQLSKGHNIKKREAKADFYFTSPAINSSQQASDSNHRVFWLPVTRGLVQF